MKHLIREMQPCEYGLLDDFLYNAIFIPQGVTPPPKSIILNDELQVYVKDFGKQKDDVALVAEVGGKIVGAVWTRIMNDYGHVDDDTPSLAVQKANYAVKMYEKVGFVIVDENQEEYIMMFGGNFNA